MEAPLQTLPAGGFFIMQYRRALIFANGKQFHAEAVKPLIRPDDYLIAADGGLYHLRALGLEPNLVIGDLDSLLPDDLASLKARAAQGLLHLEEHPPQKNETDLELAVLAALKSGFRQVVILAALGGRLDMTLANIFMLAMSELAERDIRLEDGFEEVLLIRPGAGCVIEGQAGDRVSLLPLTGPARGVRTEGLYYPLNSETLLFERTRGISNEMIDTKARISIEEGQLVCIHTRLSSLKSSE